MYDALNHPCILYSSTACNLNVACKTSVHYSGAWLTSYVWQLKAFVEKYHSMVTVLQKIMMSYSGHETALFQVMAQLNERSSVYYLL